MNIDDGPAAALEHCSKVYRQGEASFFAVREVSFTIGRGEFLAITGPSGSGKSTLLNLLGALDVPTSGEVRVLNQRLSTLTEPQLAEVRRRHVATVFQSFNLLPTLRVAENVAVPGHLLRRPPAEVEREVTRLLDAVGLLHRRDAWPDSLSGGETQRVAIARALLNRPALLLADEPTGNLDTANAGAVLALLRSLCEQSGAAVVMVTHSPEAASRADRVITMRDARVVGDSHVPPGPAPTSTSFPADGAPAVSEQHPAASADTGAPQRGVRPA